MVARLRVGIPEKGCQSDRVAGGRVARGRGQGAGGRVAAQKRDRSPRLVPENCACY